MTLLLARSLSLLLLLQPVQSSFGAFRGCDDDLHNGIPSSGEDCYAVDSYFCNWLLPGGCQQVTASVLYYNGGPRADDSETYKASLYQSMILSTSNALCQQAPSSCSVTVGDQNCNSCTVSATNYKEITLTDCSNIPGVFAAGPQSMTLQVGGGYLKLQRNETHCAHPALASRIQMPLTGELVYTMATQITPPSNENSAQLVEQTNTYFTNLVVTEFTPMAQRFAIGTWRSTFAGATPGSGTMRLRFNATITWDAASTFSVAQVAPIMTDPALLNSLYLQDYVRTTDAYFEDVRTVQATVEELVV